MHVCLCVYNYKNYVILGLELVSDIQVKFIILESNTFTWAFILQLALLNTW